jgi:hypothetical protein
MLNSKCSVKINNKQDFLWRIYLFKTLFATFLCLFSPLVLSAQHATVAKDKAIIYADMEMSAPIGYVTKGKKVKVGEVTRNKGRVLPIIVNGRIAYIRVIDIQTSRQEEVLETTSERLQSQAEEKFIGRFELTAAGFASTYAVDSKIVEDEKKDMVFTGGAFRAHILRPKQSVTYRMSMEFVEGTAENEDASVKETVRIMSLDGDVAYDILDTRWYDFKSYIGFTAVPYCQYKYNNLFTKNGYGAGAYAGLEMTFELSKYLSIHVDGRYKVVTLRGVQVPDTLDAKWEPTFYGLHGSVGLSYSY